MDATNTFTQPTQLGSSINFLTEFWPDTDVTAANIASYREVGRSYGWLEEVQSVLYSEEAADLSDSEIRRCTKDCVCGPLLFHLGVVFREAGMLTLPVREEEKEEMNLQIQRMCSYTDTNLVENTIPADSDCSWCDAKVGDTHSRACPNGERYKQAQQLLFLMEVDKEMTNLTDSQRAHLLQLYKSKLTQLGDEAFFDRFDSIRCECYREIGVDLDEMERADRTRAAQLLGRKGGESTSDSKSSAARENGRKGGRPRSSHKSQSIDMDEI